MVERSQEKNVYIRAVKLSLKFATKRKLNRLMAIRQEFVRAVRFYIDRLWESGGREKISTTCLENTHLTGRWCSNALRYSRDIIKKAIASARKRKQAPKKPFIRYNKTITVSSSVVKHGFVDGKWHDYYFEFTSLKKKAGTKRQFEKIYIPTKATKRLRYWLSKPGAKIRGGCGLNDQWLIILVEVPIVKKEGDKDIGFDCNIRRLFADSEGRFYGEEICKKITRIINCKQGSKNWKGLKTDLRNYARSIVNRLPWSEYDKFYFEDLKKIKYKIKKRIKSKKTRRYLTHWPVGDVRRFLEMRAVENGVFVSFEKPSWTSTTCPACGYADRGNRVSDLFKCTNCGHEGHADTVGALNVLIKGRLGCGERGVPRDKRLPANTADMLHFLELPCDDTGTTGGIDFGNATVRAFIVQLCDSLNAGQTGEAMKQKLLALAEEPCSRLEELGITEVINEHHVASARQMMGG